MRIIGSIVKWGLVALIVAVIGVAGWLYVAPPELVRLGTAYSAKIVCSNTFLAGRDGQEVLAVDVQSPGHPLLGYISVDVDEEAERATARLLGIFAPAIAGHREGYGCSSMPQGVDAAVTLPAQPARPAPNTTAQWPIGERVHGENPAIAAILANDEIAGPGMRAAVVVQGGRIVAERYAEGFGPETPLLGWSKTKTVTAAIVGTLIREGRLSLEQDGLMDIWSADVRSQVTLADLMSMSSGLEFNEDYGDVTDVTRMLYFESDMAGFASGKEPASPRGESFNYSSGTSVLISRIWQDAFDDPAEAMRWPREALFGPLGMTSAVMETDANGTFVGSSYLYATARDWARFGLFLARDGRWFGHRILPDGFVAWMREPAPASDGIYGNGQLWLVGPGGDDDGFDLPEDIFWLRGHDGQTAAVIPSLDLVVVRLGLTPSRLAYRPQLMVELIANALGQ
ncbi:MAG: serine hydrolase domain-containing protein [Rhizobiaceae bacterium]